MISIILVLVFRVEVLEILILLDPEAQVQLDQGRLGHLTPVQQDHHTSETLLILVIIVVEVLQEVRVHRITEGI